VTRESVRQMYREVSRDMEDVNERVVRFHSRSVVRLSMQEYSAQKIYSQSIFDVEETIESRLRPLFAEKGVELESFALRKIDFDKDYVDAVEKKQIAQERIKTAEYEAESAVNEAKRQAELAKGEAQAQVERARGEAEAIGLRGEALRGNPDVLRLNFVERLSNVQWGILPAEAVTPFLPLPAPTPGAR
jgi:regulator of protease activity HflC (stomatin/prohibitin superfamily)